MKRILLFTLLALFTSSIAIADSEAGKTLHQENCISCHAAMTGGDGTVLYTRSDRRVNSSNALQKQIHRCQSSLGLNWSQQQLNDVHQYLNANFYKF